MTTVFTHKEWFYTCSGENLFTLTPEELFIYRAILNWV